mmetsp:Transcript_112364/g.357082  ORF Transcript_112364/g.357082 Transcript_112364/m.357082 type:complete len:410 (-) Transcript_112364:39-1268(-)
MSEMLESEEARVVVPQQVRGAKAGRIDLSRREVARHIRVRLRDIAADLEGGLGCREHIVLEDDGAADPVELRHLRPRLLVPSVLRALDHVVDRTLSLEHSEERPLFAWFDVTICALGRVFAHGLVPSALQPPGRALEERLHALPHSLAREGAWAETRRRRRALLEASSFLVTNPRCELHGPLLALRRHIVNIARVGKPLGVLFLEVCLQLRDRRLRAHQRQRRAVARLDLPLAHAVAAASGLLDRDGFRLEERIQKWPAAWHGLAHEGTGAHGAEERATYVISLVQVEIRSWPRLQVASFLNPRLQEGLLVGGAGDDLDDDPRDRCDDEDESDGAATMAQTSAEDRNATNVAARAARTCVGSHVDPHVFLHQGSDLLRRRHPHPRGGDLHWLSHHILGPLHASRHGCGS